MIAMDENAAYLGECALIPQDSPIQNTGITFYETLFDENASCHLALGTGFENCIRGYEEKTLEECRALGINDSMIHVDFMIGAPDMSIDAVKADGTTVPLFRAEMFGFFLKKINERGKNEGSYFKRKPEVRRKHCHRH